ncbi:M24 family metallopeptidase [Elusimicrobiota bacterium]
MARIKQFQKYLVAGKLQAYIFTDVYDQAYFTGLNMHGYWLVAARRDWWIITNRLLDGAFRSIGVNSAHMRVQTEFHKDIEVLMGKQKPGSVGFDGTKIFFDTGKHLDKLNYVSLPKALSSLRAIKDDAEIDSLRKSCRITAGAMEFAKSRLRPGASERRIAMLIEDFMRRNGAAKTSFELIVASGPNSAVPHHVTGERKLKNNDAVVIDIGCIYETYCSDMTRTFAVGKKPTNLFKKVHSIVQESQKEGVRALRHGAKEKDVDWTCRNIIKRDGFERNFTHNTGHGVGLEVHEAPWLRPTGENTIENRMVVTVEPGIYIDGKLGVRIEDTVLVTSKKPEILTQV